MSNLKETVAYQCWNRFRNYFVSCGVGQYVELCRKYYKGEQDDLNLGKPNFNICKEHASKATAKIMGTPYSIEFEADSDVESLNKLDDFYAYQCKVMQDDIFNSRVVLTAIVEGTAIVFTSYDADTYGIKGKYRGFLKRMLVPVENFFVEDPHCEDAQDQRYLGYTTELEVRAVRELVEETDKKKLAEIYKQLANEVNESTIDDADSKKITVITRFFRDKEGEVLFEMATRYVNIFIRPHYLNPKKNDDFDTELVEEEKSNSYTTKVLDYADQKQQKSVLYTKAVKQTDKDYEKSLSIFYRYPVSILRIEPINNSIYGTSLIFDDIANQDQVNNGYYYALEIMKAHASPKIIVKEGALKGQEIDNSPWQVITDHTPYSQGYMGIRRLEGASMNSGLIEVSRDIYNNDKQINGFDSISSDNMSSDVSGFAYQQYVKQMNISLEIPQKYVWHYIEENAKNDLLYFRHYVDEARYYVSKSESEYELQLRYQEMSQRLTDEGLNPSAEAGTDLDKQMPLKRVNTYSVDKDLFMRDWFVSVVCMQGIAGSAISESQHYNQAYQYLMQGQDPQLINALIQSDPAFSRKVKNDVKASIELAELSENRLLKGQIEQYKAQLQEMASQLQRQGQSVQFMGKVLKSYKKAALENAATNEAYTNAAISEGEKKSNNAKGMSEEELSSYYENGGMGV